MDDPALRNGDTNAFGSINTSCSKSSRTVGKTAGGEKVTTPTSKSASTTLSRTPPETDTKGNYVLSGIEQNYVIVNNNLDENITELKDITHSENRGLQNKMVNLSSSEETNIKKTGEQYNHIKNSIDASFNITSELNVNLKTEKNKVKLKNVPNYETLIDLARGFYSQKCKTLNICKTNTNGELNTATTADLSIAISKDVLSQYPKRSNETTYQYFNRIGAFGEEETTVLNSNNLYANFSLKANLIDFEIAIDLLNQETSAVGVYASSYISNSVINIYDLNGTLLNQSYTDEYGNYTFSLNESTLISHAYLNFIDGTFYGIRDINGQLVANPTTAMLYIKLGGNVNENATIMNTFKSAYVFNKLKEISIVSTSDMDALLENASTTFLNWVNNAFDLHLNPLVSADVGEDYLEELNVKASDISHRLILLVVLINYAQQFITRLRNDPSVIEIDQYETIIKKLP